MQATQRRLQQEGCGDERHQFIEAQPVLSGGRLGAQDAADAMIDHPRTGSSYCRAVAMCVIAVPPIPAPPVTEGLRCFLPPRRRLGLCPSKAVAARMCKRR